MKFLRQGMFIVLILSFVLAGCGGAQVDSDNQGENEGTSEGEVESKGELTFGVTPWTSTVPPTYVAKNILEDMGYEVNLQNGDAGMVYAALSNGDIDIFMDAWLPNMHANYIEEYGDTIVQTSMSYPDGELGWVVPTYVEYDSIEELAGNLEPFEHKMYGIEEGAGMTVTSREMIEGYGLDLEYVASSEPGMLTQAQRLIDKEEPVIFLGWRPHPMFANWDLKLLEDPKKYFEESEVHVITHEEVSEHSPEAFEFLSNWQIPVDDIEQMIVKIEDEDQDPDDVAREWIENNEKLVNDMLDGVNAE
ncbi:glycine betaine ABC transporter substrate-binding protein [Caldalkalibacillus salinus]|uniref:glycine betaine ABC transporter substrate-binding protein n=1 Tax=Caldalkalibacillus salinus TaxID=2803787 RepID=UPI00192141B4|nr:glycine betaine ABC transporter substrate-binding protein [Caldalkalibacillus salinus]